METKPLVVIVGPTASGKSALAINLAEKFGGEIICADSRTVYKGMDIGTAKPTKQERKSVPHWGLDLVEPGERFTAADFKKYANEKIADIRKRRNVPIIVGGSGLYIDGVIFDYQFGPAADEKQRHSLEVMSLEELHEYCHKNNIQLPENHSNKRYVIRAIEQKSINKKRRERPIDNTHIVGIATDSLLLRSRIERRAEYIYANGVVNEAKLLGEKYGWDNEAMTGNIYPECLLYLQKEITTEQLIQHSVSLDWKLAKRQLTWLRRNPYIQWLALSDARRYLSSLLAPEH